MTKELKVQDFSNKALSSELGATVNEKALREWFDKSAQMIIGKELSTRGWQATVNESGSSAMLETYSGYVVRAHLAGKLKGAEKVHAKELITVTQGISRDVKAGEFVEFLKTVNTWKEYTSKVKPKKTRGTGDLTGDEKEAGQALKEAFKDADGVITVALEAFRNLDSHYLGKKEDAKMLVDIIRLAIKNSDAVALDASVARHPANA
jgi:hypothetical protein